MGVPYVDHLTFQLEKRKLFCRRCSTTNITSQDYLISDQYVASSGKAALFEKVSFYNDLVTDMFIDSKFPLSLITNLTYR